ncbi:HOG (high osmolarity glycerol) pathway protein [Exophiala xenobiotica]|nr:HOG (high osmolarity glycerol) pathway protein [Exophiala xenobiotica]
MAFKDDGPPYSEDDDIQSPIVTTSRHKKHKSNDRGRSPGDAGPHRGFLMEAIHPDEVDGPGEAVDTFDNNMLRFPGQPQHRDSNFAKPIQRNPSPLQPREPLSEDDYSEPEDDTRFSKDYSFTIASPDEEMHGKAVALFDFESEHPNELPLKEGQIILVSYRHGQGWLVAEDPRTGESGLVPEEFVRLVRDIEGGLHGLNSVTLDDGLDAVTSPVSTDPSALNTPVPNNHDFPSEKPTNGGYPGTKHPPIQSKFSTSSRDFSHYPLPGKSEENVSVTAVQAPSQEDEDDTTVFFYAFQPLDFLPARSSIVDTFAPNKVFWWARIHASANFTFAVEVGERDVEAVDVGGDYGQEEHNAIEDEIFIGAGKEHHSQRWEEYVAKGDDKAFEQRDPHLETEQSKHQVAEVKYVLLDCDNTLVLSERLAFEACSDLTNELMEQYNIPERYTVDSLLEDFVGQNFRGMLIGLQKKHNFQMPQEQVDEYVSRELGEVIKKLKAKATPCPGVPEQLERLKKAGYPMSVVSTSAKPRVVASLEKTGIDHYFPNEHVYSAATSLDPPSSKPDPKIYLYACEQLGVKPSECITVEDSKSGATAAMRAGIPLIAYVGVYGVEDGKEKMEQMAKLLTEQCKAAAVMYHWDEFPEILKKLEAM